MAADSIDHDLRDRLAARMQDLPILPTALAHLMTLDPESDDYFDDVLRVLEGEPNFVVRLLSAANSAASAPANPITTLHGAVARIGSRGAANLVLALSVTRVFVPRDPWERGLWRHGVQVAHAARALARHAADDDVDPDQTYVCALLHDVGRFVLFQEDPERLRAIDEGDWDTPKEMVEQEQAICGLTHPEIGAMACEKWGLPDLVGRVVRRHHDPLPDAFTSPEQKTVAIVRFADFAMFPSVMPGAERLDQAMDAAAMLEYLGPRVPSFMSLTAAQLHSLVERAGDDAEVACRALGVGA